MAIDRNGRRETEGVRGSFGMVRGIIQEADRATASPCNSLEPDEEREGGAWGQCCRAGVAQQEGVRQLAGSESQHLQVGTEPEPAEAVACDAGNGPGAAAATPNIKVSSIATNLWTKAFIRMPVRPNLHGLVSGELSSDSIPLSSCFLSRGSRCGIQLKSGHLSSSGFRNPAWTCRNRGF